MKKPKNDVLLAIDVGNTVISLGLFDGDKLIVCKIPSKTRNFGPSIKVFLECGSKGSRIKTAVSSVVPGINRSLGSAVKKVTGSAPYFIKAQDAGVPILLRHPEETGTDRVLNAVAAHKIYKKGAIVVDAGSATTLDVVSPKGEYLGGTIAPGIEISSQALWNRCAKLRPVSLSVPGKALGRDTHDAMRSGIVLGHVFMVEGLVSRLKREIGFKPVVIGTGGMIKMISKASRIFDFVDENLTLKGIKLTTEARRHREK